MGKLVRDKIDDKIRNSGEIPITRILDLEEYEIELLKKIDEEYLELKEAINQKNKDKICEESADLFEVIKAYNELMGSDFGEMLATMNQKRQNRGGFTRRLYLERVEK